jgi:transcriptional regulator with XRE-family HTH domain
MSVIPTEVARRQVDVGKLFHLGQSAITKWKTGKDLPSLPRSIEIAKRYGVNVEWLMTGRGPMRPGDAKDQTLGEVMELWDKLSEASRLEVAKFVRYQRTIQITASPERVKEVHEKLQESNHKAKAAMGGSPTRR